MSGIFLFADGEQLLHHIVRCGANNGVFQAQRYPFQKDVLICVRIPSTVAWTVVVYIAGIIFSQKGTGGCFCYIVAVLVHFQVAIYQVAFLHTQHFCYTLDIRLLKTGRMIFTAIGTIQAIYLAKRLLMQIGQRPEHFVLVALLKQLLVHLLMVFCILRP